MISNIYRGWKLTYDETAPVASRFKAAKHGVTLNAGSIAGLQWMITEREIVTPVMEALEAFNKETRKMKRFENAQVGDKVYCRLYGYGEVAGTASTLFRGYPIQVAFERGAPQRTYTLEGRTDSDYIEPTLFYRDETSNYLEERPVSTIKGELVPVDTKVLVRNVTGHIAARRYYSHKGSDMHHTIVDGQTSWTSKNAKTALWYYAELAEPLTIDGVTYPVGTKIV